MKRRARAASSMRRAGGNSSASVSRRSARRCSTPIWRCCRWVFAQTGHDLQSIGLLLSLFAVPVLAVTLLAGPVSVRLGALTTARLAIVLAIAGFGSLSLTSGNFWLALASRLVHGVGFGLYLPAIMTYGQSRLNQVRFVGLVLTFSALIPFSYALAPAMGEFVLSRFGVQAFFLAALVPGVVGLLLTIGLRPLPRPKPKGLDFSAALRPAFALPLAALFVGGLLYSFSIAYLAPDFLSPRHRRRGLLRPLDARHGAEPHRRFGLPAHPSARARRLGASVDGGGSVADRRVLGTCRRGSRRDRLRRRIEAFLYPVVAAWISQGLDPRAPDGPAGHGDGDLLCGSLRNALSAVVSRRRDRLPDDRCRAGGPGLRHRRPRRGEPPRPAGNLRITRRGAGRRLPSSA